MALMAVSSVMISFGGVIVRNVDQADPWQINFYRALGLFAVTALILLVQYRGKTLSHVREIGRAGLFGGAILALSGIGFVQALTHSTVANTLFILSAIPFITAVLARVLLGERLRSATLVTMLIAAAGLFVMVAEGIGTGSAFGNAMALVTAICFSCFAVIVRHNRHINMLPTLSVSGLIIVLAAFAVRLGDLAVPLTDALLCLLWGGLLTGFTNTVFIFASRYILAAELTLFMLLEFALGPIWVWLFVAEVPTRWTLAGGMLVFASVTLRAMIELRRSSRRLRRGRPSPI